MPEPSLPAPRTSARSVYRLLAWALLPGTLALLAGCSGLPAWQAGEEDAQTPSTEAVAHEAAQQRLHAAVQAAQPGRNRLATARHALEGVLADEHAEARALHPYARALLEQIRERQQLATLAERQRRKLDEGARAAREQAQELDAIGLQNAELQRKLDALAEIERRLSPPGLPARPRTGQPE